MSDPKPVKPMGQGAEPPEPTVLPGRSPLWFFVLAGVLLYLGMGFLASRAGGFHRDVFEPYASYDYVKRAQGKLGGAGPVERGEAVYNNKGCAACHQKTGAGAPGQFPPLAGSDWVNVEGPNRLIRIVAHGFAGPVTVNGQAYSGAMPQFLGVLNEKEIADVISYIRNAWGNKGSIVTEEQVKSVLGKNGARSAPWSESELLGLPLKD